MKQFTRIITLIIALGLLCMGISYSIDLYEMVANDKYYEGYIFFAYIYFFDLCMILPLVLTFFTKNKVLIIWSILSILSQNLILLFGFMSGAIVGIAFSALSISLLVYHWKSVIKLNTLKHI